MNLGKQQMSDASGFTLIEMVLVIVLLGLLAAMSAPMLSGGLNAFSAGRDSIEATSELRYAMARMTQEIRETGGAGGSYTIAPVGLGQASINFTRTDGTTMSFGASGANLVITQTGVNGGPYFLSRRVQSLVFNHYQSDGVSVATSNVDVAFVEVILQLAGPNGGLVIEARSRVAMRPI